MISRIVKQGLGFEELGGGRLGGGLLEGIKGGVLWNEGGMGSAGKGGGRAVRSEGVKEGLMEGFGVLRDTLTTCRRTGLL
ncbi:alanine:cation symporter family protein, partial [Bacillus pumilus]|uniref:alanine:cation symporter family protein n=1 Tax=Bacillus pumilus TaxID=1408 RepID=UPI003703D730